MLALAALLFAVFALHSEATGRDLHTLVPAGSTVAGQQTDLGVAAVADAPVVAAISSGSRNGPLDCALLAIACVLLLTLVARVYLTRLPARYRRLLDAGGGPVRLWQTHAIPIHRPSLTLLSISRV
ncbi:hypothetical protein [Cryobacterium sp. PH29-G1]|uniref:hypothetical protein n=1 Tax=Cryobacterium sp. PH29-G1 TaxID=3046211 RepID=UPI0024B933FD|nr:hypothetical protein [Cryobacterium sp. PH29-G1]MDJ0348338.1 hypothetical protein [Cryobacterium sp. PH29-G1]